MNYFNEEDFDYFKEEAKRYSEDPNKENHSRWLAILTQLDQTLLFIETKINSLDARVIQLTDLLLSYIERSSDDTK